MLRRRGLKRKHLKTCEMQAVSPAWYHYIPRNMCIWILYFEAAYSATQLHQCYLVPRIIDTWYLLHGTCIQYLYFLAAYSTTPIHYCRENNQTRKLETQAVSPLVSPVPGTTVIRYKTHETCTSVHRYTAVVWCLHSATTSTNSVYCGEGHKCAHLRKAGSTTRVPGAMLFPWGGILPPQRY